MRSRADAVATLRDAYMAPVDAMGRYQPRSELDYLMSISFAQAGIPDSARAYASYVRTEGVTRIRKSSGSWRICLQLSRCRRWGDQAPPSRHRAGDGDGCCTPLRARLTTVARR